jgi:hypothetical protein
MTQIMITNGGKHTAQQWAMTTADMLVDASALSGERAIAAERLKLDIAEVLEKHHADNQWLEAERISKDPAYINEPYPVVEASADALESVLYITDHTEWRNHFRKDEVQNALQEIIARHFCSAQLIERQWYASDNPDCPHVQVFNQASIDKGII